MPRTAITWADKALRSAFSKLHRLRAQPRTSCMVTCESGVNRLKDCRPARPVEGEQRAALCEKQAEQLGFRYCYKSVYAKLSGTDTARSRGITRFTRWRSAAGSPLALGPSTATTRPGRDHSPRRSVQAAEAARRHLP